MWPDGHFRVPGFLPLAQMASPTKPTLPAPGTFLQSIRDSSRKLRAASQVEITDESIRRLLLSPAFTMSFKRVSTSHGLALPLNFSSPLDELNLLSVLSLLNFGSGYRTQLRAEIRRGAWDSIRAFVFGLYITSSSDGQELLSAKGMQTIGIGKVAEIFGVSLRLYVEKPHPTIPGLTIGQLGGQMYDLMKLITGVLNETGDILVKSGYPSLGAFVAEALREGHKAQGDEASDGEVAMNVVLERLVRAFPGFQDLAIVNGQSVYCFKKALFLIHAIVVRFGSMSPPPFPIPTTTRSPIFTDNVVPSMLIHLGVLDVTKCRSLSNLFPNAGSEELLSTLLDSFKKKYVSAATNCQEGPVVSIDQGFIMRAAAIDACELIVEFANSDKLALPSDGSLDWLKDITLPDLDMWLWAVAKDREDYRDLPRFALKDTLFF